MSQSIQENYTAFDERGTIRADSVYCLDENTNYSPSQGNLFLTHIPTNQCVGGIEKELITGLWMATIKIPYDLGSDSDCKAVCEGTRNECIDTLWLNREQAYIN